MKRYFEELSRVPVESYPQEGHPLEIDPRVLFAAAVCFGNHRMDPSRGLPSGILRALEVLKKDEGVLVVLLYGSRARGDAGPDSDWDFFVFCERYSGKTQDAVLEAQELGSPDGAFFMPGEVGGRLNPGVR